MEIFLNTVGDYLIIPRGMIYRIQFEMEENRIVLRKACAFFTPQNDIRTNLASI
jgi:homogentisate 1,2-dioxygenase